MATPNRTASAASGTLQAYSPALVFTRLVVGVDNIRHDVFLSPRWREQASQFLFEQILHHAQPHLGDLYRSDARARSASQSQFKLLLAKLLQEALTQAKENNNIEIDLLARLALYRWLSAEVLRQFSELALACKERVDKKSTMHSQSNMTAFLLRSRITEYQSSKRAVLREVGESLYQIFEELEETRLRTARAALFGSEFFDFYRVVRNRQVFLENPNDAVVNLEHYVMLGQYARDTDYEEGVQDLLAELLREQGPAPPTADEDELLRLEEQLEKGADQLQEVNQRLRELEWELGEMAQPESKGRRALGWLSGRSEGESSRPALERELKSLQPQRQRLSREVEELEQKLGFLRQAREGRVSEVLANPGNAEHLFGGVAATGVPVRRTSQQDALLRRLYQRLERAGVLKYILSSYHIKSVYKNFCPPLNPQQLKRAVVDRKGWEELETLMDQFPARNFPVEKLEEVARRLRRIPRTDAEAILVRFARDLMNLRRDFLHLRVMNSLMEKVHLLSDERTRQVSRMNGTLYEFVLPEEREAGEERVLSHVIIKADIRESTRITEELLQRNLNPATHFSSNFFEPVRKLMARYDASKIFLEGDALIMGIFETESNRASQRPVAKACLLAKEVIQVCQAYNQRARANDLPILELGLGVAHHEAAPHYWTDGESRIMISPALNLSDRLSSCTRRARRLLAEASSPFNVFLFQGYPAGGGADEEEEFLVRFNVMGVELSAAGFQKLQQEISLTSAEAAEEILGERRKITLHYGTVPIGEGFEKLIVREAPVLRLQLPAQKIAGVTEDSYYEVCVDLKLYQKFPAASV